MVEKKKTWRLYSYVDAIRGSEESGSPYGMTTYDLAKPKSYSAEKLKTKRTYLTHDQKKTWKHMYAGFVAHGMKLAGAKRKASGILRGQTTSERRGHREEQEYNRKALYAMHKWFEEQLEFDFAWVGVLERSSEYDLNIEYQTEYESKNRRFMWQLTALDGEIMYGLIYEKGKISKLKMWSDFPVTEFQIVISGFREWL